MKKYIILYPTKYTTILFSGVKNNPSDRINTSNCETSRSKLHVGQYADNDNGYNNEDNDDGYNNDDNDNSYNNEDNDDNIMMIAHLKSTSASSKERASIMDCW